MDNGAPARAHSDHTSGRGFVRLVCGSCAGWRAGLAPLTVADGQAGRAWAGLLAADRLWLEVRAVGLAGWRTLVCLPLHLKSGDIRDNVRLGGV
jgi:hypothetical protein